MIRLLVAVVVCLALHPAVPMAHARERTLAVAAAVQQAIPASVEVHADGVAPPLAPVWVPPASFFAVDAPLGSFTPVARLWLRAQRLLC